MCLFAFPYDLKKMFKLYYRVAEHLKNVGFGRYLEE